MKYKLLVLDIDGTIITKTNRISDRTKNAVREVQKKGILVTLTTGRMFRTALPFIHDLNIALPVICYQGALIKNPKNNELLFHEPIPLNLAQKVVEVIKKEKIQLNVYINDALFMTRPKSPEAKQYLKIEKQNRNTEQNYINLENYKLKQSPTKFTIISNRVHINKIEKYFQNEFKNELSTTRGIREFLDVLNLGISKGKALKILTDYLGIKKKEIISIGDYYNDIPMFAESGLSVAMKNTPMKVKKATDYVTDSVENDGAAKAIEKFLLKNH